MTNMNNEEYGFVGETLLKSQRYVKDNAKNLEPQKVQDFQTTMNLAMGAMQAVSKRMKTGVPSGGSSMCKDDKIKDLFQTFTLNR